MDTSYIGTELAIAILEYMISILAVFTVNEESLFTIYIMNLCFLRSKLQLLFVKVVRMLVAVLVGFILCWTSLQVLLLWDTYRSKDTPVTFFVLYIYT